MAYALLTVLTLWLLASERWGSYIPVVPHRVYISDAVLAIATVWVLATRVGRHALTRQLKRREVGILLAQALVLWATVRLATSPWSGFVTLRDFAPYGYGIVATLVAAMAPRRASHAAVVGVWVALAFHSTWVLFDDRFPTLIHRLPVLGGSHMLLPRPDVDGMMCGITIAMCLLYGVLAVKRPRVLTPLMILLAVSVWDAIRLPSRGGLLASVIVVIPVLARLGKGALQRVRPSARPLVAATALGAAVAVGLLAMFSTVAGARLQDSFVFDRPSQVGGTTHARVLVYEKTTHYIWRSASRTAVGDGFGPDFLHRSGAAKYLEGVFKGVRSPHDYLLGTWARLGVVGMVLALALTLIGCVEGWLAITSGGIDSVSVLAASLLLATPMVAAVGVVLESPFGAIPWFWAFGVIAVRRRYASLAKS